MKFYSGERTASGCVVKVRNEYDDLTCNLPPRSDLINHSPDGFEWGYSGSGPAQLALAILADALTGEEALGLYQRFKTDVIAQMRGQSWIMTEQQVADWVAQYRGREC